MKGKAEVLVAMGLAAAIVVACSPADGAQPRYTAAVPGWRVAARVVVPGGQAVLVSVDAPTRGDAWAAGFSQPDGSQDLTRAVPVLEHWAGHSWRRQSLPQRARRAFGVFDPFTLSVRVSPGSGVWLFGTRWLHMTRKGWSSGSLPVPKRGWTVSADDSAVLSAADVWVFGTALGRNAESAYSARYNGVRWHVEPVPGTRPVSAVSVVSPHDMWGVLGRPAVELNPLPGPGTAVVRWNGARWAQVAIPSVLRKHGYLTSALARTDRDVWIAGGLRGVNGGLAPAVAHWDGHRWSVERVPTRGTVRNYMVSSMVPDGHGGAWASGLCVTCDQHVPALLWHMRAGHWSAPVADYAGRNAAAWALAEADRTSSVWGVGLLQGRRSAIDGMIALYGRIPQ